MRSNFLFYSLLCVLLVLAGTFLGAIFFNNFDTNLLPKVLDVFSVFGTLIFAITAAYSINTWKSQHYSNHQADIARRIAPKLIEMIEFLHFQEKDFSNFVENGDALDVNHTLNTVALYETNLMEVEDRMRSLFRMSGGISKTIWDEISSLMQTAITERHDFNVRYRTSEHLTQIAEIYKNADSPDTISKFNLKLSAPFLAKLTARRTMYSQSLSNIYHHLELVNRFQVDP